MQYAQYEITKRVAFDYGRCNFVITTMLAYIFTYMQDANIYTCLYTKQRK